MTEQGPDAAATVRVTVGRRGGDDVLRAAREAAPTGVAVREVGPTGLDRQEPVLAATRDGRTAAYGRVTPSGARGLIDALADELLEPPAFAVADATDDGSFPAPEDGPLAVGERRTLAACGWVDPTDGPPVGGTDAAALEATARESGFRGRGRGDAVDGPVVGAWDAARTADGDPIVVVNGVSGDPDADADRLLLESDPAAVVDAAVAVADVVGATDVVALIGADDGAHLARNRVAAVAAAADRDVTVEVCPEAFDAVDPPLDIDRLREVSGSADDWAVASGTDGKGGRPTVVHTPRTLAGLRASTAGDGSTRADADWFGSGGDPGTRLVTVCGDADRATVELPTDAPLSTALGAVGDPAFRFACVGGRLGGLTRTLDVAANADTLTAADLGTNGTVELFDESRCPVAFAGRRVRYAREHGCDGCEACRGTVPRIHERLRAVYEGEFDPEAILNDCATLDDADCPIANAAARPVRTALDGFESAFESHSDGECPTGECN